MTFPIPPLGSHTLVFGPTGSGRTSLLKGIAIEAALRVSTYFVTFEESLSQLRDLQRAGVHVTSAADADEWSTKKIEMMPGAVIILDAIQAWATNAVPTLASVVDAHCDAATAVGSSLVVSVQVRPTAVGPKTAMPDSWDRFGTRWVTGTSGVKGQLQAKCVQGQTVGQTFDFRSWR